jgi:hypothetical protein
MKFLITTALILTTLFAYSSQGDTTNITIHQDVDMIWYGQYKQWGVFPIEEDNMYRKVTMDFEMGCASNGCSGWDYDVHIYLRHRTGVYDSTLVFLPSFTANGQTLDSLVFSNTTTYTNTYNDSLDEVELIANDTIIVNHYEDINDPILVTSTEYVFAANYYDYTFDETGNITDSTLVTGDNTYFLSTTESYDIYEVINDHELARAITPYGTYMTPTNNINGYDENWKHVFSYDVTDFQNLLKDSVEFSAFYSGWSSGFSVTLDFEFIEGTPARDIVKVQNIYKNGASGYSYTSSTDFEANQMPAVSINTDPSANDFKLQFVPTGHGQAGEFTPGVSYTLLANGNNAGGNDIWKDDCGANAIWPQGGTWIFDRANWCPGEAITIFNHEIGQYITPGQPVELDINFSSFNPNGDASYSCAVQFFQYKEYNFSLDAEITDIITPSKKDVHLRKNPNCGQPIIEIKNSGSSTLTSLEIEYNVKGGTVQTFQWTGSLEPQETQEVTLDALILDGTSNLFEAKLLNPNGSTDQHADNDYMASAFEEVPVYPSSFVVRFKSNNFGNQNNWNIKNGSGEIEYEMTNFNNNTLYSDTVTLTNGCHTFNMYDSGGDGLDFWYWNQVDGNSDGTGFLSLKRYYPTSGNIITFTKDFGSGVNQSFMVEDYVVAITENNLEKIAVYPNPTTGEIFISSTISDNQSVQVEVRNILGDIIFQQQSNYGLIDKTIDISNHPDGVYMLRISSNQSSITQRIVLSR